MKDQAETQLLFDNILLTQVCDPCGGWHWAKGMFPSPTCQHRRGPPTQFCHSGGAFKGKGKIHTYLQYGFRQRVHEHMDFLAVLFWIWALFFEYNSVSRNFSLSFLHNISQYMIYYALFHFHKVEKRIPNILGSSLKTECLSNFTFQSVSDSVATVLNDYLHLIFQNILPHLCRNSFFHTNIVSDYIIFKGFNCKMNSKG
jgi:hypothetical protein